MSTPEEPDISTLSLDATHSTYEVATGLEPQTPPSGPQVVQTLGTPDEAPPARSSTKARTES
jgi:hypothetical protein